MIRKLSQILVLNIILFNNIFSQGPVVSISDIDWTSTTINGECNCDVDFNNPLISNFTDAGGVAPYNSNENETITLCPDATGSKMFVTFGNTAVYTLNIDPSDTLYVFDGPSVNDPLLAAINDSTYPNGIYLPASWSNTSGCLTFKFVSDASLQGTGWDAFISCSNLPQPFTNHISAYITTGTSNGSGDTINDLNPTDTGFVDICFGDFIEFVAEPYFPYEPGGDSAALSGGGYMQSTNYTTTWELSDGSLPKNTNSFLFTPSSSNGYLLTLKIEDSIGKFYYSVCKIRVSTKPIFSSCGTTQSPICLGRMSELYGGVTGSDTVGVDPVLSNFPLGGVFGSLTYLPDGSGTNYTTDITISGFLPGATIQNPNDIEKMCVKMEHSYLGDLEMKLTCPSGQSVNIFNSSTTAGGLFPGGFGGGNDFLGGAFDDNTGNVGDCEQYCFSNLNNAMPAFVNGYNTIAASGQSPGVMVVPGLYEPEETYLPSLVGCPVNGTWTLTVRDNFIFDDGFICEWGIYFNSILSPNQVTYSTSIVSANWVEVNTSVTTIVSYLDTNIVVNPPSTGTYGYKFEVEDEFGCSYDTIIEIVVELGGSIIGDTTTCGDVFDYNNNYLTSSGGEWSYTSNNGNISFDPNNTVANPMITASEPGTYVMNLFDLFCNDTLTNIINLIPEPIAKQFSLDTICLDQEVLTILDSSNSNFIYRWFDNYSDTLSLGDTLRIIGSYYSDAGINTIKLSVSNQCGEEISENDLIIEDCVIPNVITPNGDGLNDFFITKYAKIYNDVNITILNRWGKLVYEASNYQNQWNGLNTNGSKLSGGTYYYFITYNQGIGKTKGSVQIISK